MVSRTSGRIGVVPLWSRWITKLILLTTHEECKNHRPRCRRLDRRQQLLPA